MRWENRPLDVPGDARSPHYDPLSRERLKGRPGYSIPSLDSNPGAVSFFRRAFDSSVVHALVDLATVVVGLAFLVFGGDRVVSGASSIAATLGVSTFFVGVTVVAVGSSIPEIATAVYASQYGSGTFAVGHIVGSATSQITLGIGIVALVTGLAVSRRKTAVYGGGMLVAMGVMYAVVASGTITRVEGVLMVALYVGYLVALVEEEDYADHPRARIEQSAVSAALAWTVVGFAFVVTGGHFLVSGSQALARSAGIAPYLIGLVTGLGTTSPEIAVALLAVRRDSDGIAVGTLLGSNITDPLFSLGLGATVAGFEVVGPGSTLPGITYMLLASAIVLAILLVRDEVGRLGGLACLVLYVPSFLV